MTKLIVEVIMKLSKVMLALAAGSAVSSIAVAQAQVTGKKQEGFKLLMPGLYGNVEIRQNTTFKSDELKGATPVMSVAPTIGTTLWNKAVDTSFTSRYAKGTEDPTLKTAEFYNETSWAWIKGDFGSIGPYAYTELDTTVGQLKASAIGMNFTYEHTYPIVAGDLKVKAFTEPKGVLLGTASGDTKLTPRNDTGVENFGLASEEDRKVTAKQAPFLNDSSFVVSFAPAAMKDFSIDLGVDLAQKWAPLYVASEVVDNKPVAEQDGYEYKALTTTKLAASYKIQKGLSLGGELRQYLGGVYGYSINPETAEDNKELGASQYESRVTLTADLF